jgi:two-component system, chemotaxis family, chemotaxis protein CheY
MAQTNQAAPTVLVIDDSNLCRELVVEALRGHGYATLSAPDGEAGITRLEQNRVDAVILDNEMPKMNGLEFLKAVRGDIRWEQLPVVMLTTNVSKEVISEAMSRKISGYLLKAKFSMPEMLARVGAAVVRGRSTTQKSAPPAKESKPVKPEASARQSEMPVPATMKTPNLVTRDATLAMIAEFKSAKTLLGITSQIASIASSKRPSMAEMAAVIRQDPVLAARVVHLAATSAPSGQKTRLASIDDAVRAAGIEAVRDLAASLEVVKEFPDVRADGMSMLRCWQHALATAVIMGRIVPKADTVPTGLPHLVGLCHDLPEIILRQGFPSEFAAAVDFAMQAQIPVSAVVLSVFGVSYAEITASLLQHLKFPASIADPIKEFSLNAGNMVEAHKTLLTRSLAISDFVANGMMFASSADATVAPVLQNDCRTMLIPTTSINFAEIRSETMTSICMVANITSADEALYAKPLLNRSEANIWYVRNSNFAGLDPIEAALNSMANVRARDRTPQLEELAGLQGLVILSPAANSPQFSEALRMRTQGKKQFPILHIVSGSDAAKSATPPNGVEVIGYPISLTRLAQFVAAFKAAN